MKGDASMGINEMKSVSFPQTSIEDWEKKSEESLKGRKVESLSKTTFENIKLKPLYTNEDQSEISQFPGQADFRRGSTTLGYLSQDWKVAQRLRIQKDTLKDSLAEAFDKGQSAISFEVDGDVLTQISNLEEFHGKFPYSINAKEFHSRIIDEISKFSTAEEGNGFIARDPLALFVETGLVKDTVEEEYTALFNAVKKATISLPNIRTVLVDTVPYHNGGANAVQELAIAISTAIQHMEELSNRGLSHDEILSKLVFQFSIGSNFFMELSKLRAARLIWDKTIEAYRGEQGKSEMVISASTSYFTKTIYDPYVNLLRAGNEAFSAVLGGIKYLHVTPFNEPEQNFSELSNRIARNTQLILKEEAHLSKTVDPAGGSWYVEHLTTELAEKAWALFLEIEDNGGIVEALKKGWIQSEIANVREKRQAAVATRKQTIVGTNKYADLKGTALEIHGETQGSKDGFIKAIPQVRLSQPYETLRKRSSHLKKQGKEPVVGLLTLGALKSHKARTDFITGFLSPGGIEGKPSEEIHNINDAIGFINSTGYQHYCICGSNDQYEELGLELVKEIKAMNPDKKLYLAGIPDNKEQWNGIGINDFIHVKSNCYDTLASLLDDMEVEANE